MVTAYISNPSDTITVTDTAGNTYSDCGDGQTAFSANSLSGQCFIAKNTHTTASNVVSITCSGVSVLLGVADEYTGGNATSPVDAHARLPVNATTPSTGANAATIGPVTSVANGDLIYGAILEGNGVVSAGTSPNSFTQDSTAGSPIAVMSEHFSQTSAGSISATFGDNSATGDPIGGFVLALKH